MQIGDGHTGALLDHQFDQTLAHCFAITGTTHKCSAHLVYMHAVYCMPYKQAPLPPPCVDQLDSLGVILTWKVDVSWASLCAKVGDTLLYIKSHSDCI